jgi:predicted nuclease with TOPRIM domain
MRERIRARIKQLQAELDTGNRRLQELELEQARLREVMLRITGAKQVLEELLDSDAAESNGAPSSSESSAGDDDQMPAAGLVEPESTVSAIE